MLVFDTECYRDYWVIGFKSLESGKVRMFELYEDHPLDVATIRKIFRSNTVVGFNSISYDMPMISFALQGVGNQALKDLSDAIIKTNAPAWVICRERDIKIINADHIDLISVAPGEASLKAYGGRLHAPKLQDLPIHPDDSITPEMREDLKTYLINDLDTTELLYNELKPRIEIRTKMSDEYSIDLRSKSDSQIAEAVIKNRIGGYPKPPKLPSSHTFVYDAPYFIEFRDINLKRVVEKYETTRFRLTEGGGVDTPTWLHKYRPTIGDIPYAVGIGGLHSCEKSQFVREDEDTILCMLDVTSYYPNIIQRLGMYPQALGSKFTPIYQSILDTRVTAKKEGDTETSETLKIVVNGTFGKLGSKYSVFYSPELLIRTTVTGQLSLMMLIERLHYAGIRCVSANTDGIALLCPKRLENTMNDITFDWMLDTSFNLERTDFKLIASRDVNNYIGITKSDKVKGKGVFTAPSLAKNPDCQIIYDAISELLLTGKPIEDTINECRDIRKFVTVKRVTGGGIWCGIYLGKTVRFYPSNTVDQDVAIRYTNNGNMVGNSSGTRPLMTLPESFPDDVDLSRVIAATHEVLRDIGYERESD